MTSNSKGLDVVCDFMTSNDAPRITSARDLGRAGRGLDITLGVAAILPIVGLCAGAAIVNDGALPIVRTAAAIWTGCLLAFLSGVRRGLSFSERAGARPIEIVGFLCVFLLALLTLILRSPAMGSFGLAFVGASDWAAARRLQAPGYFKLLRPIQMGVGCLGLLFIAVVAGA